MVTFKGEPLELKGTPLTIGAKMPEFRATCSDMSDFVSSSLNGKVAVLLSVPSVDTPTCDLEVKRFNKEAEKLGKDVSIVVVSYDLPFAQKRWCGANGVSNLQAISEYKYRDFGEKFGVFIPSWGLLARGVFVFNKTGSLVHSEYVSDISLEPNYDEALKAVASSLG
jgi:thiol peroxidase